MKAESRGLISWKPAENLEQGSPTFVKLRANSFVLINAKGYYIGTHFWNLNFAQFSFSYVIINDVNLRDDTHHLNAIFKTAPRASNVVLAGDLVPLGNMLQTPDQELLTLWHRTVSGIFEKKTPNLTCLCTGIYLARYVLLTRSKAQKMRQVL